MKTHINGHTEMATKYQLSKLYTKVQTHINLASSSLSTAISGTNNYVSNLENSLLEKYNDLLSADIDIRSTITNTANSIQEYSDNKDAIVLKDAKNYSDSNKKELNNTISELSTKVDNNYEFLSTEIEKTTSSLIKNIENTTSSLIDNDEFISGQLKQYVDKEIDNLGSVYSLVGILSDGTIATSIEQLPTNAKKGQIYFINKTLTDGTTETEQYICINDGIDLAINKYQKFGTSVDLSKYLTINQINDRISGVLSKAAKYTDDTKLEITNSLQEYSDNNLLSAKFYTNNISSFLDQTLKAYSDNNANNTLTISKKYTDDTKLEIISSLQEYSDNNLLSAKNYANQINTSLNTALTKVDHELVANDNTISSYLKKYIDDQIDNLGSIYTLIGTLDNGEIATSLQELPTNAKKGQIYFINKKLTDGTTETEQYICIREGVTLAADRWQKFGTSVDLSKYITSTQVTGKDQIVLNTSKEYTDDVSAYLDSTLKNKINSDIALVNKTINETSAYLNNTLQDFSINKANDALTNATIYIDETSAYLNNAINTAKAQLSDNTEIVSGNIITYIDKRIENLGSVYSLVGTIDENGTIATSIIQLPLEAKKGQIYFVKNTLSDGTQAIEQYISITNDIATADTKYQKFGTTVDLSKYLTIDQIKAKDSQVLSDANKKLEEKILEAKEYTNTVSGNLSTALTDDISKLAKEYTDNQLTNKFKEAKDYTNAVSGNLSAALTDDIFKLAKDYTNIVSGNLSAVLTDDIFELAEKYTNGKLTEKILEAENYTNTVSGNLSSVLTDDIFELAKKYTDNQLTNKIKDAKDYTNTVSGNLSSVLTDDIFKLAKDYTDNQLTNMYKDTESYTNIVSGNLSSVLTNDISALAKAYTNSQLSNKFKDAENYINEVSGNLSAVLTNNFNSEINKLSTTLEVNIPASAKAYTNDQIEKLKSIYAIQRKYIELSGISPTIGLTEGNSTYTCIDPISSFTGWTAENSDYETVIYFTTHETEKFIQNGMPTNLKYIKSDYISKNDVGDKLLDLPLNTSFIITIRNLVARIEQII